MKFSIKKTHFYFGIAILALVIAGIFYYFNPFKSENPEKQQNFQSINSWSVDENGYLSYPLERGEIGFKRENHSQTDRLIISKVVFESKDANIYGFLVLPKSTSRLLPGVVLLPGAGVSKEAELELAMQISGLGIAVLTIDARGVGETNGYFPDMDEDYKNFAQSKEPIQHLVVYDALRGFDLLRSAPFVDPDRIIIMGESYGGRIAIIAAAIDRNVKGALVISSAGSNFPEGNNPNLNKYLKSIDANHYVDLIAPRPIIMIHNAHDKNIPISLAAQTFDLAQQPKNFLYVNDTDCNHGYCPSMKGALAASLEYLVGLPKNANLAAENESDNNQ